MKFIIAQPLLDPDNSPDEFSRACAFYVNLCHEFSVNPAVFDYAERDHEYITHYRSALNKACDRLATLLRNRAHRDEIIPHILVIQSDVLELFYAAPRLLTHGNLYLSMRAVLCEIATAWEG